MSEKEGASNSAAAERARKGKGTMNPDDEQKEEEEKTPKVSDEIISMYYTTLDEQGDGEAVDFDEFVKGQQQILDNIAHAKNAAQDLQIADSSKEDSDGNTQIEDYDTDSSDSDANEEDIEPENIEPVEQVIFELQISEGPRLVIPYIMASDYFPPLVMMTPNAEETLYLIDPRGKRWKMTLIYDSNANTYIITNGLNAYTEHNYLVPRDSIRVYVPIPQPDVKDFYINHQKNRGPGGELLQTLFEVRVSHTNRLRILCDLAVNHFIPMDAPKPPHHLNEFILRITDYRDKKWEWKYVVFDDEESYIIIRGWDKYAAHHRLIHNDRLRFFKNFYPTAGANSFIVHHELRRRVRSLNLGRVQKEKLYEELCLTEADVGYWRLEMNGFELPSAQWRNKEMVKLTDWKNKDWYVIMVYQRNSSKKYMILDGWGDIVREHNLEAGDLMSIYEPFNGGDHDLHFVIEFVKKRKRKEPEKKKEDSGSGKPDDGTGPVEKIPKLG